MAKFVFKVVFFWICFKSIDGQEYGCGNSSEISFEDQYYCSITSDGIECCSHYYLDLESEFKRLSNNLTTNPKHLNKFSLFFTWIEEIPENVFQDISFDQIMIYNAKNLTSINSKAFNSSVNTAKRLSILGTNRLGDLQSNYNLYEAISSLVNLEYVFIELEENSMHEIPENAFNTIDGNPNNLRSIYYSGHFNISRISNYAFADSPLLHQIIITQIPINNISAQAFDSRFSTEQALSLTLNECSLTEQSFQTGIFTTLKRPLRLYLGDNEIRYIKEEIFSNLFNSEFNTLDLMGNALECDDIKEFEWLFVRQAELEERITNAFCKNGTLLWDLSTEPTVNPPIITSTMPTSMSTSMPTSMPTSTPTTPSFATNSNLSIIFLFSAIVFSSMIGSNN